MKYEASSAPRGVDRAAAAAACKLGLEHCKALLRLGCAGLELAERCGVHAADAQGLLQEGMGQKAGREGWRRTTASSGSGSGGPGCGGQLWRGMLSGRLHLPDCKGASLEERWEEGKAGRALFLLWLALTTCNPIGDVGVSIAAQVAAHRGSGSSKVRSLAAPGLPAHLLRMTIERSGRCRLLGCAMHAALDHQRRAGAAAAAGAPSNVATFTHVHIKGIRFKLVQLLCRR